MRCSIRLGQVAGVPVRAHISCGLYILLIIVVGILGTRTRMPSPALALALTTLAFFVSVFLHELAHVLAARRLQLPVSQVFLWAFGGFTTFERAIDRPKHDVLVSLAGPLANVALAALCWPIWAWLERWMRVSANHELASFMLVRHLSLMAAAMLLMNVMLAVTNILPIYPLDGGRILRALFNVWLGERRANLLTLSVSLPLACGQLAIGVLLGDPVMILLTLVLIGAVGTLHPGANRGIARALAWLSRRGARL